MAAAVYRRPKAVVPQKLNWCPPTRRASASQPPATHSGSSPAKAGDPVFQRRHWDTEKPRRTRLPAFAGNDSVVVAASPVPRTPRDERGDIAAPLLQLTAHSQTHLRLLAA